MFADKVIIQAGKGVKSPGVSGLLEVRMMLVVILKIGDGALPALLVSSFC